MHKITFTEKLDSDTLWELSNILKNELDLGVVSKTGGQCHAEERDIMIEALEDLGIEYLEEEIADETE